MAHFSEPMKQPNAEIMRHIERIKGNIRKEHFSHEYLNDLIAYFEDEGVVNGVDLGEGPLDVNTGTSVAIIKDDAAPPTIEDVMERYHPATRYAELNELRTKVTAWRVLYQARIKATDAVFEILAALLEGAEL
jgi:hypothetical protein